MEGPTPAGQVGCGRDLLSELLGNELGVFFCMSKTGVSTKVLSKSNLIHGGDNKIMHRIQQGMVRVYFAESYIFTHAGFIL